MISLFSINSTAAPPFERHRAGFTLIELLVVLAIIGVLAALIFPAMGKMRSSAKAAKCVSNLRQISIQLQVVVSEKGYYPPSVSHSTSDDGSLGNLGNHWPSFVRESPCLSCPSAEFRGPLANALPHQKDWFINGYSANPMVCDDVKDMNPPYVRPANISRPSEVIFLTDGAQWVNFPDRGTIGMCAAWWLSTAGQEQHAERELTTRLVPDGGFWDPETSLIPMRHDGRANILFIDGHVESISDISELKEKNLYWNY